MSRDGELPDPARFLGHRAQYTACDIQPALLNPNLSQQQPSMQPAVHLRIADELTYLLIGADVTRRPANTQRSGPKLWVVGTPASACGQPSPALHQLQAARMVAEVQGSVGQVEQTPDDLPIHVRPISVGGQGVDRGPALWTPGSEQ